MMMKKIYFLLMMVIGGMSGVLGQTTVFTDAFTASTGATYTAAAGAIGSSTSWTLSRSGADWGARIDGGILDVTNDASVAANVNGWAFASTPTASFTAPYNTTLNSNPNTVTWTFNIRTNRTNLAGFTSGSYGVAFVLAGSSTTANNTGNGYALVLGNTGTPDPFRLVKYTGGLVSLGTTAPPTANDIVVSNTAGFTNIGSNYYSVKVTYVPTTNTWELFLRDDGITTFADPAAGVLTSQGSAVDATHTGTSLGFLGGYWQGSTGATQTAFYDNVKVVIAASGTPTINVSTTSLSPFLALSGVNSNELNYNVDGTDLTANIVMTPPVGFGISTTPGGPYTFNPTTILLTPTAGTVVSTPIYVVMNSTTLGPNSGNISHTSTGATTKNVALSGNVLAPEPTAQSAITFGAITNSTMVVNFSGGNGARRILLAKQTTAVSTDPADGTTYTANANFGSGSLIGTGNYVVYDGTGFTQLVTGLTAGATYHFAVYEYNNSGVAGAENYFVPGGINNATTATYAVPYVWTGVVNTDWQNAANWAPVRLFPATNDSLLFINLPGNDTITNVPTQSVGYIGVSAGSKPTLVAAAAGRVLSVGNLVGTDFSVAAGSEFVITGTNDLTVNIITGANAQIDGNVRLNSGAHRFTAVDASAIVFRTGSLFRAGTGLTGSPFGTTSLNSVIFNSGSVLEQIAGSNPFGASQPSSVVIFQTGSLYKVTSSSVSPSFSGRTYANIEISATGYSATSTGGSLLSFDNFTMTTGIQNLNLTGGVHVKGNITVAAGQTLTFTPLSANTITFNGTTAQSIANSGTFSIGPFVSLTMNNAAGVSLNTSLTMGPTTTLTLTAGVLTLTPSATTVLTLSAGTTATGASNASFVQGKVSKIGNTAFTFPVGSINCGPAANVNGYAPITISVPSLGGTPTDNFRAQYIRGNAQAMGANTLGLDHVSSCEYWILDQISGASTLDLTLNWNEPISNCTTGSPYVNNLPSLVVAHFNGTTWNSFGAPATATGMPTAGDVTWPSVSTFSPFTIGSINFSNPLPITLNYFNGTRQNSKHLLNWKVTCNSVPSVTMDVQRSVDGVNFSSITNITASALRCEQPFEYTDAAPLKGFNYYRLKMTDSDGQISYSSRVALTNNSKGIDVMNIAPNPIVGGKFNVRISTATSTRAELLISDMQGRMLQMQTATIIAGYNQVPVNVQRLSAGTYQLMLITADGDRKLLRFVVQ